MASQAEQAFEKFRSLKTKQIEKKNDLIEQYEEKVKCVTTTIQDAIEAQKSGFGSSYGYGMSSGPRSGQRQRMVGYSSPSRRAPRARGTTAKRRRSPMMY